MPVKRSKKSGEGMKLSF